MALVPYVFKCVNPACEMEQEPYDDYLERDTEHKSHCSLCGKKAQRIFSLAGFTIDFTPGFDVGLGRHIETKAERENYIAENGIRKLRC